MRKIVTLLLVFAVLLSLTACGKKSENAGGDNATDNVQTQAPADDTPETPVTDAPQEEITAENWGASARWTAQSGTSENFLINFPKYSGYTEGNGLIAEQLDGTTVIVAGQNDQCPSIDDVSELFPAYYDHLQLTFQGIHGIFSKNYVFTLKSDSSETVGDYKMHKFTGEVEFDNLKEHMHFNFVAYATTLKSNGAYAYWVVYDTTEDQSNGALLAEHAANMAKTFRE